MKRILTICLLVCLLFPLCAQHTKNVCGEVDYVMPETQSQLEARRTAIERARIQALADEFGTIVSQTNTTTMHNTEGQTKTDFNSFSASDVRGVWVEDTNEPEITMVYDQNQIVFHVKVCGKARELKSNPVELQIETINYGYHNGEEHPFRPGYETTQFKNNDFFGVRFKAPIDGYVAIFFRDDNNDIVYTQLPYEGSDGYAREVKSNKEYTFLNNQDPEFPPLPSAILTTDRKIETNTLVVVFSKRLFHMSLTNHGEFFPEMELPKFQKWLHSLRVHDETAQVEEIVITIKK